MAKKQRIFLQSSVLGIDLNFFFHYLAWATVDIKNIVASKKKNPKNDAISFCFSKKDKKLLGFVVLAYFNPEI